MPQPPQLSGRSILGSLVLIAVIIGGGAAAFAFTAGWFSPQRLTPTKVVDAFKSPSGVPLGHRRNHAKGICFTGVFEANGAGSALSQAQVFTRGQYPVLGRFNLGTPDPDAADATVRVRGMGLQISTPDGQVWRSAMINPPIFAVSTPQGFSLLPAAQPVTVSPDELGKRGPDFLEQEITERVRGGPQRWTMLVTVANPGDPTADPTKAWPDDRRAVDVGTLTVQQIEPERDGPCRDINFDPTLLPSGIRTSDDPFPAARSAVYAKSYDLRTAEAADYPRTVTGTNTGANTEPKP
jgi:catalase